MYHVAPAEYNKGEHIYSKDAMEQMGYTVQYKWAAENEEENYTDANSVAMHESLEDAQEFLDDWLDGKGIIIEIDDEILEDAFKNGEGYWSVYDVIDADLIAGYVTV